MMNQTIIERRGFVPVEFENDYGKDLVRDFRVELCEAIQLGVLPPSISHTVSASNHTKRQYEQVSREIKDLRKELNGGAAGLV